MAGIADLFSVLCMRLSQTAAGKGSAAIGEPSAYAESCNAQIERNGIEGHCELCRRPQCDRDERSDHSYTAKREIAAPPPRQQADQTEDNLRGTDQRQPAFGEAGVREHF